MASNIRELVAVFRGVDEVTPVMNQINGGLTNTARLSQNTSREMTGMGGMLTREWEKFRRTFGYAFAGEMTYKIFQAYQNLQNYSATLGQINAMLPNVGGGLNDIGNIALQVSTKTGAPLQDVLASIQNIIQSLPNLSAAARQHIIPAMAEIEAMGAQVMGTDPRAFGSTVLGIARAFHSTQELSNPRTGPRILERIASQLYETRITTPRVTGQDITQYIPMLIGGARAGRFSLPQALSLFTVAQQTIQRPATTAQYLRQLMLRLRRPTAQETPFFRQAGIGPQQLANLGGMDILTMLIRHAESLPGGIPRPQLQRALKSGDFNRIANTGPAAQFLNQAIGGRIQSLVAVTAIASNLGQVRLQEDRLAKHLNELNDAFARLKPHIALQRMSNAISNATTDLLINFMPALSVGAGGLTFLASESMTLSKHMRGWDRHLNNYVLGNLVNPKFARQHNIIGGALDTGLTVAGLYGLVRSPRGISNVLGRILRRNGGSIAEGNALERGVGSKLLGGIAAAETPAAAISALANQANGTPSAPFWVVIHPLSMSTVPRMFGGSTPSGVTSAENKIKQTLWNRLKGVVKNPLADIGAVAAAKQYGARAILGAGRGVEALGGRLPGIGLGSGLAGGVGLGVLMALAFPESAGKGGRLTIGDYNLARMYPTANWNKTPAIRRLLSNTDSPFAKTRAVQDILFGLEHRTIFPKAAEQQLEKQLRLHVHASRATASQISNRHVAQIDKMTNKRWQTVPGLSEMPLMLTHGQIDATFTLVPTQELKNLVHPQKVRGKVPVKLWNNSPSAPTERGKAKVTRNRKN